MLSTLCTVFNCFNIHCNWISVDTCCGQFIAITRPVSRFGNAREHDATTPEMHCPSSFPFCCFRNLPDFASTSLPFLSNWFLFFAQFGLVPPIRFNCRQWSHFVSIDVPLSPPPRAPLRQCVKSTLPVCQFWDPHCFAIYTVIRIGNYIRLLDKKRRLFWQVNQPLMTFIQPNGLGVVHIVPVGSCMNWTGLEAGRVGYTRPASRARDEPSVTETFGPLWLCDRPTAYPLPAASPLCTTRDT